MGPDDAAQVAATILRLRDLRLRDPLGIDVAQLVRAGLDAVGARRDVAVPAS